MSEVTPVRSHSIASLGEFKIFRGFDETVAKQVVDQSTQPSIRAMTPRDPSERFPDVDAAMEWYHSSPDRIFYSLGYRAHLAGIIWFSKSTFQDAERTFAIRVYEPFSGHGLGTTFGQAAHEDLVHEYSGSLWADFHVDNIASQTVARKLGYTRVDDRVSVDPTRVQFRRPGFEDF